MKKWPFVVPSLKNKFHVDRHSHLGWAGFTELLLSKNIKYGKQYIEWQTNKQGMRLSNVLDYLKKREGNFKDQISKI